MDELTGNGAVVRGMDVSFILANVKRTIRFSCLDASPHYLILGAHTGSLYVFDRFTLKFMQLVVFEELQEPISQVRFSPDERFLAFATSGPSKNIYITPFPIKIRKKKDLICITQHKSDIRDIMWGLSPQSLNTVHQNSSSQNINNNNNTTSSANNNNTITNPTNLCWQLFTADDSGLICKTDLDAQLALGSSSSFSFSSTGGNMISSSIKSIHTYVLYQGDSRISQLEYDTGLNQLLVSSATCTAVLDFNKGQAYKMGSKPRQGPYGASHYLHPEMGKVLIASRPGNRLWLASGDNPSKVLQTLNFQASLSVTAPSFIAGWAPSIDPSSVPIYKSLDDSNFYKLVPLGDVCLLTWNAGCLFYVDVQSLNILSWFYLSPKLHGSIIDIVVPPQSFQAYVLYLKTNPQDVLSDTATIHSSSTGTTSTSSSSATPNTPHIPLLATLVLDFSQLVLIAIKQSQWKRVEYILQNYILEEEALLHDIPRFLSLASPAVDGNLNTHISKLVQLHLNRISSAQQSNQHLVGAGGIANAVRSVQHPSNPHGIKQDMQTHQNPSNLQDIKQDKPAMGVDHTKVENNSPSGVEINAVQTDWSSFESLAPAASSPPPTLVTSSSSPTTATSPLAQSPRGIPTEPIPPPNPLPSSNASDLKNIPLQDELKDPSLQDDDITSSVGVLLSPPLTENVPSTDIKLDSVTHQSEYPHTPEGYSDRIPHGDVHNKNNNDGSRGNGLEESYLDTTTMMGNEKEPLQPTHHHTEQRGNHTTDNGACDNKGGLLSASSSSLHLTDSNLADSNLTDSNWSASSSITDVDLSNSLDPFNFSSNSNPSARAENSTLEAPASVIISDIPDVSTPPAVSTSPTIISSNPSTGATKKKKRPRKVDIAAPVPSSGTIGTTASTGGPPSSTGQSLLTSSTSSLPSHILPSSTSPNFLTPSTGRTVVGEDASGDELAYALPGRPSSININITSTGNINIPSPSPSSSIPPTESPILSSTQSVLSSSPSSTSIHSAQVTPGSTPPLRTPSPSVHSTNPLHSIPSSTTAASISHSVIQQLSSLVGSNASSGGGKIPNINDKNKKIGDTENAALGPHRASSLPIAAISGPIASSIGYPLRTSSNEVTGVHPTTITRFEANPSPVAPPLPSHSSTSMTSSLSTTTSQSAAQLTAAAEELKQITRGIKNKAKEGIKSLFTSSSNNKNDPTNNPSTISVTSQQQQLSGVGIMNMVGSTTTTLTKSYSFGPDSKSTPSILPSSNINIMADEITRKARERLTMYRLRVKAREPITEAAIYPTLKSWLIHFTGLQPHWNNDSIPDRSSSNSNAYRLDGSSPSLKDEEELIPFCLLDTLPPIQLQHPLVLELCTACFEFQVSPYYSVPPSYPTSCGEWSEEEAIRFVVRYYGALRLHDVLVIANQNKWNTLAHLVLHTEDRDYTTWLSTCNDEVESQTGPLSTDRTQPGTNPSDDIDHNHHHPTQHQSTHPFLFAPLTSHTTPHHLLSMVNGGGEGKSMTWVKSPCISSDSLAPSSTPPNNSLSLQRFVERKEIEDLMRKGDLSGAMNRIISRNELTTTMVWLPILMDISSSSSLSSSSASSASLSSSSQLMTNVPSSHETVNVSFSSSRESALALCAASYPSIQPHNVETLLFQGPRDTVDESTLSGSVLASLCLYYRQLLSKRMECRQDSSVVLTWFNLQLKLEYDINGGKLFQSVPRKSYLQLLRKNPKLENNPVLEDDVSAKEGFIEIPRRGSYREDYIGTDGNNNTSNNNNNNNNNSGGAHHHNGGQSSLLSLCLNDPFAYSLDKHAALQSCLKYGFHLPALDLLMEEKRYVEALNLAMDLDHLKMMDSILHIPGALPPSLWPLILIKYSLQTLDLEVGSTDDDDVSSIREITGDWLVLQMMKDIGTSLSLQLLEDMSSSYDIQQQQQLQQGIKNDDVSITSLMHEHPDSLSSFQSFTERLSTHVFQQLLEEGRREGEKKELMKASLQRVDQHLWSIKSAFVTPQISNVEALEKYAMSSKGHGGLKDVPFFSMIQTSKGVDWNPTFVNSQCAVNYVGDAGSHWGVHLHLQSSHCDRCGLPLLDPRAGKVSIYEKCEHAYHEMCVEEEACPQCLHASFSSLLGHSHHPVASS